MTSAAPPTIDLMAPESFARGQPHDQFRWLRTHDPVHWHPEPDGPGFWAVTRYEDVKAVGRDPGTFSSVPTIMRSTARFIRHTVPSFVYDDCATSGEAARRSPARIFMVHKL